MLNSIPTNLWIFHHQNLHRQFSQRCLFLATDFQMASEKAQKPNNLQKRENEKKVQLSHIHKSIILQETRFSFSFSFFVFRAHQLLPPNFCEAASYENILRDSKILLDARLSWNLCVYWADFYWKYGF